MVATFILDCVWLRTKPCKYFQLNARDFNADEGIFSKLEIDQLIPPKWRLSQVYDDREHLPQRFPVFLKPEWGQNANGIFRADDAVALAEAREETSDSKAKYLIQEAASEAVEFEIFSILDDRDSDRYAHLTVTEVINDKESYPVNSIFNANTRYQEISDQLTDSQKARLWALMGEIRRFGISRVGLRADSVKEMLAGRFHVIEINLYVPMPINMLDQRYGFWALWKMVRQYMMSLARITKARDRNQPEKPVFTKLMLYNRDSPLLNRIRKLI